MRAFCLLAMVIGIMWVGVSFTVRFGVCCQIIRTLRLFFVRGRVCHHVYRQRTTGSALVYVTCEMFSVTAVTVSL